MEAASALATAGQGQLSLGAGDRTKRKRPDSNMASPTARTTSGGSRFEIRGCDVSQFDAGSKKWSEDTRASEGVWSLESGVSSLEEGMEQ